LFEPKCVRTKNINGYFATVHFCIELSSAVLMGNFMSPDGYKITQRGSWVLI